MQTVILIVLFFFFAFLRRWRVIFAVRSSKLSCLGQFSHSAIQLFYEVGLNLPDSRVNGRRNLPGHSHHRRRHNHSSGHYPQYQEYDCSDLRRSPSVAQVEQQQQSMAMVRHSPATQGAGRSAWPSAPTSSTPPEAADETVPHTQTANLHGAIGEHRRSSRSSSVSSGGSNNSAEGAATTSEASNAMRQAQGGLSRLSLVAASSTSPATSSLASGISKTQTGAGSAQDAAATDHGGTNGTAASGSSVSPPSSASLVVGTLGAHMDQNNDLLDGRQPPQPLAESEAKTTTPSSVTSEHAISSPFGFFMGGGQSAMQSIQSGLEIGTYSGSDPPRQGRPIMGTSSSGPFSPGMPHGTEVDLYKLIGDGYSSSHFSTVQPESNSMGLAFFDNFQSNSMSLQSDSDLGAVGYPMSSNSMSFQNMGGAYSNFQPYVNPSSGAHFSQNYYGGSSQQLQVRGRNGGFYSSSQPGYSSTPGYYSPTRQNPDYFGSHNSFQPFGSQDFSLPPPAPHPWRSGAYNHNPGIPDSVLKRVTCPSCAKQLKWPHVLQCLHVFCFPCICAKYNSMEKTITCPSCSRKTPVPDGPCGLKLDYQGCRYMREIKVFPFGCTGCTREQEAVTCCTTCMAYLCSECQHGHNTIHQFQGHVLNPIGKVGKSKVTGDYQPFCPKHLEEQTKFCVTCDTMMCEQCVKEHTHSDGSNGNNCHSLNEVHDIVIERMKTWNEDSSIKAKDTSEMAKRLPLLLQSMDNKKRAIRKQIEEYSDYCKHVVDQNRAAAFESLDKAHSQMECHVNSWSKSVSGIEAELVNLSSFNIRTTEQGSVADVLSLLPMMEEEYKRIMAGYSDVIKDQEGIKIDLKFDPNYRESHDVLNSNFTTISFVVNGAEHRVTPSLGGGHRGDSSRGRSFVDYSSNNDNPDCNYQRWSAAPDSMSISTWNNGPERERKGGTYIPQLNRSRVKTSYVHMFGEYGRGEYAFTEPSGQAYLSDGSYVICDTNNHRIVYYNAKHEYIRTIGQPPNLPPVAEDQESRNGPRGKGFTRQEGYLYFPNRVAICPLSQNIVATERPPSHDIQIFTKDGNFVRCFGGNILQHPRGVTVDEEGIIIVVECKVMKLVMFTQEGNFIVSHSVSKELEFPNDVAARDRKIFISDNRGHCVQVFNYEADFLYKIGNESITYFPIGVSINYLNQVVVTDNHNTFNITVFDMTGNVLTIFESVSKLAQCHNVAVHPSSLELMLTTKDCSVYFFNYDPNVPHPQTPPITRAQGGNNRRGSRISSVMACNPNGSSSTFY
ncbi:B-box type Zinc finger protein ncl-1 [Plakobranchus ocellatus]|uniref:B-box type Zinc finger protein ncl-1 n=1 Tax=Plakobranchus ocellatus TaxID=259542 RepID=A0AAV3YIK2_9GAST|nr:B-box type Zinc finger protein ncl-1 [Plakobranchus ocellatus]